jgi:hypothetical protein
MFSLQPPRHISTLPVTAATANDLRVRYRVKSCRVRQRPARQLLSLGSLEVDDQFEFYGLTDGKFAGFGPLRILDE